MSKLVEQIRADATTRLPLPPNRHPNDEQARFQKFLKLETHRLKLAHRDGGQGREICEARAVMLDLVLQHLLQACERLDRYTRELQAGPYAVVAIGGYGRAELNPHSDVDVMFLHTLPKARESSPLPFLELMSRTMVMFDLFPKVGYSVRNLDDCVRVANTDMKSKTSLIEARLIHGDAALFTKFGKVVRNKCVKGHENAYIEARIADQDERRARYGNSASLQEPNVKNGCGGLRDYQNLIWMAYFRRGCRSLAELREQELISESEHAQLSTAYDFLLRVRNELHYHHDRAVDVLARNAQPAVARNLGYTARSLARRVSTFMSDYYRHARHIHLITRTIEQRLAFLPQPKRLPTIKQFLHERRKNAMYVVDGFKFVRGEVHPAAPNVFEQDPTRLLRVFRHGQQRGCVLGPDAAQLVRNSRHLLRPEFRADPRVQDTFLEILRHRGNVAPALRAMHEVGVLGALLPAFGRLTGLVQHEFFHIYTADEHTLVCVEMLDQLQDSTDPTLRCYVDLFQEIERPELLYLALLLHDVGKGRRTADHAASGSRMAVAAARRLGLDAAAVDIIRFLVGHHLAMVHTGLKRDLDDPDEIEQFARLVENTERLKLLTLLTVADTRGTSTTLWNGFKNTMLSKLYTRTAGHLAGKSVAERADQNQRNRLARTVREQLDGRLDSEEIEAHFAGLPARYCVARSAREVIADLELMHEFMAAQLTPETAALEPVMAWHDLPDQGYTQLKVCTWDHQGAFSQIAGALTAAGLTILRAEVFTREEGVLIDTFLVLDGETGQLVRTEDRSRCERLLRELLVQRGDPLARVRRGRKTREPAGTEAIPTQIWFDNDTVPDRTVIEVEAEDRLGLLYSISHELAAAGLDITVAKIATEKGAASDTFYVRRADGGRLEAPEAQRELAAHLKRAIDRLPL
ncbi:MAG: [protein-PII] uridylyltransferase [Verrucomicrobiales bacterium]|nr:[protein-PII] uridylyltransferase [Verrucomicrobiales bacterium]MCP5527798.1 [protein-PII] uridylyltransferase [Verrucomicrobiales bacterium]